MSVLIKGMDMPKRCVDCPIYFAGLCSVRLQNGKCPLDGRPDWCPLEDVPEPKDYINKWDMVDVLRLFLGQGNDNLIIEINDMMRKKCRMLGQEEEQ